MGVFFLCVLLSAGTHLSTYLYTLWQFIEIISDHLLQMHQFSAETRGWQRAFYVKRMKLGCAHRAEAAAVQPLPSCASPAPVQFFLCKRLQAAAKVKIKGSWCILHMMSFGRARRLDCYFYGRPLDKHLTAHRPPQSNYKHSACTYAASLQQLLAQRRAALILDLSNMTLEAAFNSCSCRMRMRSANI